MAVRKDSNPPASARWLADKIEHDAFDALTLVKAAMDQLAAADESSDDNLTNGRSRADSLLIMAEAKLRAVCKVFGGYPFSEQRGATHAS